MEFTLATAAVIGGLGLVGIGVYGLLITRNLIQVVVALQILVKGVLLAIIVAGRVAGQLAVAQSMALTVIVADTIVAVLGLALAVQVRRSFGTLDLKALTTLRR
jgi:NADH-quinone oxidoreductase subunit K